MTKPALMRRRISPFWRTCRGFHPWPVVYPGVNGNVTTELVVWLWWSWEVKP